MERASEDMDTGNVSLTCETTTSPSRADETDVLTAADKKLAINHQVRESFQKGGTWTVTTHTTHQPECLMSATAQSLAGNE